MDANVVVARRVRLSPENVEVMEKVEEEEGEEKAEDEEEEEEEAEEEEEEHVGAGEGYQLAHDNGIPNLGS